MERLLISSVGFIKYKFSLSLNNEAVSKTTNAVFETAFLLDRLFLVMGHE